MYFVLQQHCYNFVLTFTHLLFPNNSRENVGVMFQKTMIYQGTIRDNILFGQPEQPGAVENAARAAEIAEVIERLPEKYDTVIGGDALAGMSGGQLQRVCMARALYRKPSVLLLDEGKLCDKWMFRAVRFISYCSHIQLAHIFHLPFGFQLLLHWTLRQSIPSSKH